LTGSRCTNSKSFSFFPRKVLLLATSFVLSNWLDFVVRSTFLEQVHYYQLISRESIVGYIQIRVC
jgi:hypothetical protein